MELSCLVKILSITNYLNVYRNTILAHSEKERYTKRFCYANYGNNIMIIRVCMYINQLLAIQSSITYNLADIRII